MRNDRKPKATRFTRLIKLLALIWSGSLESLCDLNLLHDGSEKPGGTMIAVTGGREMWNEAVSFTTGCVGSPTALREFISGMRKGSPDWAKALGKMARQLQKVADEIATAEMANTTPTEDGTPTDYVTTAETLGRVVKPYLESTIGDGAQYTTELARQINRATKPGGPASTNGALGRNGALGSGTHAAGW